MRAPHNITERFTNLLKTSESPGWIDRVLVPALLVGFIAHAAVQVLGQDWADFAVSSSVAALMVVVAASSWIQRVVLGRVFNRRHALHIALIWVYGLLWVWAMRVLLDTPASGKGSELYYMMLIMAITIMMMILRSLFAMTRFGYDLFIMRLPLWEQILVAANELAAASLLAYVSSGIFAQAIQPDLFTTRIDPVYTAALLLMILIYYIGMWAMWVKTVNDWLSRNTVWVRLARLVAPVALVAISLLINNRFSGVGDRRTMNLLGTAEFDLAILAIAPVVWLLVLVVVILVYTSSQGLRRRFLPDMLLEHLPTRLSKALQTISDVDIVLMVGILSTSIPVYLFLRGNSAGVVDTLREQILRSADALIETSEQALALLFALPFYLLILALLVVYAAVLADPKVSADDRDALVNRLPIGFCIVLIITLYLFSVSFSQVLTEGELPQLPQDLGRILAFDIVIPLLLLYLHYFVFVRLPYGRGQSRWRITREAVLTRDLGTIDTEIKNLDHELARLERAWHGGIFTDEGRDPALRFDALYEFVDLNGRRDKLNMNRLEIVTEKQQLAEVSEAPVSLAVARLPIRVVTIGIPLLLAIQVYQWAVLDDGLRQIANDPNIGIVEFFQIILEQVQL